MPIITTDRELPEATRLRAKDRFQEARNEVHQATADIPVEEIAALVDDVVAESRHNQGSIIESYARKVKRKP